MKPTGRRRAMLVTKVAISYHATHAKLPPSGVLCLIAGVHPATARRWLADLRAIMPERASALRKGLAHG